jgi:hypothetical protein
MKTIRHTKLILFFLCAIAVFFVKCHKDDGLRIRSGYFKVTDYNISQNIIENPETILYDSLAFLIDINIYADDVLLNKNASPDHILSPLDLYKSISLVTINSFNEHYGMLDTISDLMLFNIYNKTEYLLISDTVKIFFYPSINSLSEIFPGVTFDRLPYDSFNCTDDFFQSETSKHSYPFLLKLNTPPDTTRLFQIKINIELLDGRKFELYSMPVYIEP